MSPLQVLVTKNFKPLACGSQEHASKIPASCSMQVYIFAISRRFRECDPPSLPTNFENIA